MPIRFKGMWNWKGKSVVVTGGHGFLGSFVVERLKTRGCKVNVPRSREYDLVEREACRRLYEDARPDMVIHLAAKVGGIGANQENPGSLARASRYPLMSSHRS